MNKRENKVEIITIDAKWIFAGKKYDGTIGIRNIGDNCYVECSNPWKQVFYKCIVSQTIADKLIIKLDEAGNVIEGTLDDIIDSLY